MDRTVLGIEAEIAVATGMIVANVSFVISNAFWDRNFQLFEWGGSFTPPDTPQKNIVLFIKYTDIKHLVGNSVATTHLNSIFGNTYLSH